MIEATVAIFLDAAQYIVKLPKQLTMRKTPDRSLTASADVSAAPQDFDGCHVIALSRYN
jgi:hypothetical protein